jgi:hypothetical protein
MARHKVSVLVELVRTRMREAELLATECARCGHTLRQHPLTMRSDRACVHHDVAPHASGAPSRAKIVHCRCPLFVEPA